MDLHHHTPEAVANIPSSSIATCIPAEIIIQIIEYLQSEDRYAHWHEYPWPYTYICRYWRDVLIAAPHLWTTINIGDQLRRQQWTQRYDHRAEHPRLALQLERTGTQPLSIQTESQTSYDPKVFKLLALCHSRWQDANLNCDTGEMNRLLRAHNSWSFPQLRQLAFQATDADSISPPNPNMFMQSPKLGKLKLTLAPLNTRTLNFPWPQLTTLLLKFIWTKIDEIHQILNQCTSLLDLELDEVRVELEDDSLGSHAPITLPRLKTLTYEACADDIDLLPDLCMPVLEDLTHGRGILPQDIQSCLLLSKPPLTSLHFDILDGTAAAAPLADILGMLPSLQHLGVGLYHCEAHEPPLDVILTLLDLMDDPQVCPSLSSLDLEEASFSNQSAELFMKMLGSRSMVTLTEHLVILKNTREQQNLSKLLSGLRSVLHRLSLTFKGVHDSKEDHFSRSQLSRIRKLSRGIVLNM